MDSTSYENIELRCQGNEPFVLFHPPRILYGEYLSVHLRDYSTLMELVFTSVKKHDVHSDDCERFEACVDANYDTYTVTYIEGSEYETFSCCPFCSNSFEVGHPINISQPNYSIRLHSSCVGEFETLWSEIVGNNTQRVLEDFVFS